MRYTDLPVRYTDPAVRYTDLAVRYTDLAVRSAGFGTGWRGTLHMLVLVFAFTK